MKIAIITTVDHNVGDDFIREGIKHLLRTYLKDEDLQFQNIHKHSPITSRYGFEWLRKDRIGKHLDRILPLNLTKDRVMEADLLIQSGAPVYWCYPPEKTHSYDNEWFDPLVRRRFLKNPKAKMMNLAAGTCLRYHAKGDEFCDECKAYMREFDSYCIATSTRDTLGEIALSSAGIDVNTIPCSSIFAIDEHGLSKGKDDYVALNYMSGGAHYTFGQKIDFERWQNNFKKFYFDLKKKENVIVSCHNKKELDELLEMDPKADYFYQKDDYLAYMKFYSNAKYGIMNRIHGAFLIASYGSPSFLIGNDTRARMISEIGLESAFVNEVDYTTLMEKQEFLASGADDYKSRFDTIKSQAFDAYMKLFKESGL